MDMEMEMEVTSKSPSSLRAITTSRRRRVAPENRKRVATACNSCSLRRIKCSGERPCVQCSRSSRDCVYPEGIDKVTVPRAELEALQAKCADLEHRVRSQSHAQSHSHTQSQTHAHSPGQASSSAHEPSPGAATRFPSALPSALPSVSLATAPSSTLDASTSSPSVQRSFTEDVTPADGGQLLHDPDGTARYFGESSGANFLNHVKELMVTISPLVNDRGESQPGRTFLASIGSYQTYDSRPLHVHNVDPLWLPSRTSMTVLLTELRYFAQDGNGDFPSGGIFFWGDLPSAAPDPCQTAELQSTGRLALMHIAFAVAVRLGAAADWRGECPSEAFFSRARTIVGNPLDITAYSPREVSVLLLMALYFIEMNRRDAAYMTVSMALHLAVMYGAHSRCGQDEISKRVFWTLYILDCLLTCWLGRPPSISDEAIRLDLPEHAPGLPSPNGLRAHIELARISRYIVCNVYRISPWDRSSKTTLQHVEHALERLMRWMNSLPPELQLDYNNLHHDRACCTLHLLCNQYTILTTRPIFFMAVKKTVADRYLSRAGASNPQDGFLQDGMVSQCIDTARKNLLLGQWIRNLSPRKTLLHQEAHAIFNAAVVVLLHHLAFMGCEVSNDANDLQFAIDVFQQQASLGNNFGRDCAKVLEDLRCLVQGLREQTFPPAASLITAGDAPMNMGHVGLGQPPQPPLEGGPAEMHMAIGENTDLQRELQTWLDNDYLQLYNEYMI